jgi:hypothetical protein
MKTLSLLAAAAMLILAGCSSLKPSTLLVGSVGAAPIQQSAIIAPAPIVNPQRPLDCPRYVVDSESACY